MIKEIAFTPQIFHEESNPDHIVWARGLSEIARRMFPWGRPSYFVVSNLYEKAWEKEAKDYISRIKSGLKHEVSNLYEQMSKVLVTRGTAGDWPGDTEDLWVDEAMKASRALPEIHRVVASDSTPKVHEGVHCLSDTLGNIFWNGLESNSSVPMILEEQIEKLKHICYHFNYISMSSAYFKGSLDSETGFVIQLLKMLSGISVKHFIVDVHCQANDKNVSNDSPDVCNICSLIKPVIRKNIQLNLYYWEKRRERIFLAGSQTMSRDKLKMKVHLGINMTHIARLNDLKESEPATWAMLDNRQIMFWRQEFYVKQPLLGPICLTQK